MNKKNCDMIKDLLPLYIEDMCSGETKDFVNEHLAGCPDCKNALDKLNTGVSVAADKDISAIKKVKRRIRAGKIAVALVVLVLALGAGFFGFYVPMSTCCTMDYEKYDLAENVWVEEDADGTVWLCKKDAAAGADVTIPTFSDTDGNRFGYGGENSNEFGEAPADGKIYNMEKMCGYGVTLQHRRFNELSFINEIGSPTERTQLFDKNKKPQIQYVFYFDDVNNVEYTLWER